MEGFDNTPDFAHFFEMEEMRKTIKDLREEINSKQINKEEKYSHVVQMLILDYLKIGKGLITNVERAKLYAPLIRRDLKTTEQYLSGLYSYKNEKNLIIIIDFFNKAGFPDLVQDAQNDLIRVKKRKD